MSEKKPSTDPWVTRMTLLGRAKDPNDALAWEDFFGHYEGFIRAVFRRMNISTNDQDDMIQTVLLKVWKVLPTFEFDKEKAKFRTWLGRLVRNAVIDFVRSEKKHHEDRSSGEFLEEHEDPQATNDLDDIIQKEWENNMVRLAFEAIRPKFSERAIKALEMSLQGASIEEISEKIGIKENSAYKLRNRAKKHLILEVQRLREELEQT